MSLVSCLLSYNISTNSFKNPFQIIKGGQELKIFITDKNSLKLSTIFIGNSQIIQKSYANGLLIVNSPPMSPGEYELKVNFYLL